MTSPFETSEYRLAKALNRLSTRISDIERKDNAIFEVKTTTGRPTARGEYHFVINTFDGTVEVYADGAWRDLIGAGGGYTDEDAQDAVGTILVDTATIDFTYDDATPEITADVIPGGVDHDSLLNYSANEHVDHTGVTLTAGDGLSGGGDISANRTFDVDMLGLEDLADPGADRIYFWDDGAGLSTWLVANDHLSISGTNLNVDDDFVLNTGDTMSGDLDMDGNGILNADTVDINQTADNVGWIVYGYDDQSAAYLQGFIASDGASYLSSANALVLSVVSGGIYFGGDNIFANAPLKMQERAAAAADQAGYGQLWVKNTTPCELWFTDDAGTDTQIV